MTEPELERTTVPGSFRARLVLRTPLPDGKGGTSYIEHGMSYAGKLHVKEYGHAELVAAAQAYLQPLVDIGWAIRALTVKHYDEVDA